MAALLRALPLLVLVLAAVESVLVRIGLPHRPTEPTLFFQALLLWLVFGLLALLPAWGTRRLLLARRRGRAAELPGRPDPAAACLLGWLVLPVAAHVVLERYTGLATDLSGRMAGLAGARPWVELLLVVLLVVLLARVLARPLAAALRGRRFLAVASLAALAGLGLPWHRPSSDGPLPAERRPNLLLLVWDTCRRDRLDVYDYERDTTPHLARLADEALVFDNARSASVFTFSSHLTMLTGVYPSRHGGRLLSTRYDPRRAESLAAHLRSAGYRTGAFVGTDVLAGRTGIRFGFDRYDDQVDPPVCDTRAWKLVHDVQSLLAGSFAAFANNGSPHWIQDFQRPASEVLSRARAWIEADDPRPWFCFVNLYDAHWPYLPDEEARARLVEPYDGPVDGYLFRSDAWPAGYRIQPADARHVSDLYDAELYDLDRDVDGFLGALDLAATAVVMTSDHGEAFGEGGRWKHEDILEPQVRVPLLVRPAGGVPARLSEAYTSGVDVAPTLLSLAGVEPPPGLAGLDLTGPLAADRVVLVEDRDHVDPGDVRVALYSGPFKLVRLGLGEAARFHLYHLERDPVGEHDVASEFPDVFAALRERLVALRAEADVADLEVGDSLGAQADALRALGYVGGDDPEPPGE